MDKQKTRDFVADFLENHANAVRNILQTKRGKFNFSSYVEKFNKKTECGTVCCMAGWLPETYPQYAKWKLTYGYEKSDMTVVGNTGIFFKPHDSGIPIKQLLWNALTVPGEQKNIDEPSLHFNARFKTLYSLWMRTAKRVRNGELDKFLHMDMALPKNNVVDTSFIEQLTAFKQAKDNHFVEEQTLKV